MDRRRFLELLVVSGFAAASRPGRSHAERAGSDHKEGTGGPPAARVEPAEVAPQPIVGLTSHTYHWREPAVVGHVAALGIRHVRTPAVLQHWESTPSYDAAMRETAAMAAENRVRLLWVLHAGTREAEWPTLGERMARFAAWTAALPATEGVQIWNEHDHWAPAALSMRERGRVYARQVPAIAAGVRAANPSCLVVTGGTAEHPSSGFLTGFMESPPRVDAVAIHAYGPWEQSRERIATARRIVGDHAPVWATECGSRHHTVGEEGQLADWRSAVEGNESERLAARQYLYALDAGHERGHSLLDPDGTPRMAYEWLARRKS